MKIEKFNGLKIHGYLKLNVDFNSDVSFLLGINGTGKTTVMSLIDNTLGLNFYKLFQVEFESILIVVNENQIIYNVKVLKLENSFEVKVNNYKSCNVMFDVFNSMDDEEEFINYFKSNHLRDESISILNKLPSIKFLNLDRELRSNQNFDMRMDVPVGSRAFFERSRGIRGFRESKGMNFEDALVLIREAYSRSRSTLDRLDEKLKEDLIQLLFKQYQATLDSPEDFQKLKKEIQNGCELFKENKKDFESILGYLIYRKESKVDFNVFLSEIVTFVDRIEEINRKDLMEDRISIELLVHYNNMKRIVEMERIIKKHKATKQTVTKDLETFTDAVNSFFTHNGKEIYIDQVGRLRFKIRDFEHKKIGIKFSSGETHLIMIFAMLILDKKSIKEGGILIIDEPELSLHLHWQEMLVESILKINSDVQYIFATHSPTIIGNFAEKIVNFK